MVALGRVLPAQAIPHYPWRRLAKLVDEAPARLLATITSADGEVKLDKPLPDSFPMVVTWAHLDHRRITPVPPGHWLLIQDTLPFRASLEFNHAEPPAIHHVESIPVREGHIACFAPRPAPGDAQLLLERYAEKDQHVQGTIRFLAAAPETPNLSRRSQAKADSELVAPKPGQGGLRIPRSTDMVLLTNGRGGMARLCVDLGRIQSKYDCLLGANLHPTLPVDRHIFAKRVRLWVNADGFISPLDFRSLAAFQPGPPAIWNFVANAGDGRTVEIQLRVDMVEGRNTTVLDFSRPVVSQWAGRQLAGQAEVRLTARIDIEDRNFHSETRRNGGAEHHFSSHVHPLGADVSQGEENLKQIGFAFTPAPDRQLRVFSESGSYNPEPEWSENIPHPIEQSRGQIGSGDAFSPGWFDLPLEKGGQARLVVTAEVSGLDKEEIRKSELTAPKPGVMASSPRFSSSPSEGGRGGG